MIGHVTTGRIILDLSRLLSRAAFPAPTGIDRVELAYAQALMARQDDRLTFAAMHPLGRAAKRAGDDPFGRSGYWPAGG